MPEAIIIALVISLKARSVRWLKATAIAGGTEACCEQQGLQTDLFQMLLYFDSSAKISAVTDSINGCSRYLILRLLLSPVARRSADVHVCIGGVCS